MAKKDPRDNFISLDTCQLRYNSETGVTELHVLDKMFDGRIEIKIDKKSADEKTLRRMLRSYGLAPADNVQDELVPKSSPYQSFANEGYRVLGASGNLNVRSIPIGEHGKGEPVFIPFGGDHEPNVFVAAGKDGNAETFVSNLVKSTAQALPHIFETFLYSPNKSFRNMRNVHPVKNDFELLMLLRMIFEDNNNETDMAFSRKKFIILDEFSNIVAEPVADDSSTTRTAKAVRAEILSLIENISRLGRSKNIHFVFIANHIEKQNYKKFNAFISSSSTLISLGRPTSSASYVMFMRDISSYSSWPEGRGYISSPLTGGDNPSSPRQNQGKLFQSFDLG